MSDKPVVVRTASGAELGFRDADTARRMQPDGEIVRHQDGTPFAADAAPEVNLADLTRDELDAYAARLGVDDPAALPNKAAVIAAIEGA